MSTVQTILQWKRSCQAVQSANWTHEINEQKRMVENDEFLRCCGTGDIHRTSFCRFREIIKTEFITGDMMGKL